MAETTAELYLRTIARLPGVSTLVELGTVERRDEPPSSLFGFVPENLAERDITTLTPSQTDGARRSGPHRGHLHTPTHLDSDSDLDLIMVRSGDVSEDDALWRSAAATWRQNARRLTGNRVEVIEVNEHEVRRLLHSSSCGAT